VGESITVLIVDDHAMVRVGLRNILQLGAGHQVVGEARDGIEAVEMAVELKPNVVLMDIFMPRSTASRRCWR